MLSPISSPLRFGAAPSPKNDEDPIEFQLHAWESEGGAPGPQEDRFERKPVIQADLDSEPSTYNLHPPGYVPPDQPSQPTLKPLEALPEPYALVEPDSPAQPIRKPKPAKTNKPKQPKSRLVKGLQKLGEKFRTLLKKLGF